ncbi:MAG: MarR family transcriptional regulator [Propionicimonas sp.]
MPGKIPESGDPQRDALVRQIFGLYDLTRNRSMELVGPAPLPPDLTMQQIRCLGELIHTPGITVHALAGRLGVSTPTASGLVERLAEKGLVERHDDEADRRVRRLHVTRDGLTMMGLMESLFDRVLRAIVNELSMDDLDTIRASSLVMLDAMARALVTLRAQDEAGD